MSVAPEKRSFVRLPREKRMRDIEKAARLVFSQHGFDAAPVNEIAAEAGISEGSIYKFYTNKRDLLHTIRSKKARICAAYSIPKFAMLPITIRLNCMK